MDIFLQLVVNGLLLGGTLAIISIGLTLIFGIVRVVNFAHGEFLMIGMYAVYLMYAKLGLHPYVSAFVAVILFAGGALMQRFVILINADPHIQIFATVGVSTALLNLALLTFGADVYPVKLNDSTTLRIGPISVVSGQLITPAFRLR